MRPDESPYQECSTPAKQRSRADVLDELFTYHTPSLEQVRMYQSIRSAAKHLAEVILDNTPRSADQSAALRHLREAVMTANAAIALNGLSL